MSEVMWGSDILQDVLAKMNSGVWDFTENGECSNCGNCCSNLLPVSAEEIKVIKKYIKAHEIKASVKRYPLADPVFDFTCPFRDDVEKKCRIYPVRPNICRYFRCDKPSKHIACECRGKYNVIDVREVFYG